MNLKCNYKYYILIMIMGFLVCNSFGQSTEIVFLQANQQGSKGNLVMMDVSTKSAKQIGKSGSRPDYYPNWSPDGEKITFLSYRRGGWRIWITNPDGSDARRLDEIGRDYEFDPAFGKSGEFVFYSRRGDIFKVNVKTGKTTCVVETQDRYESQPNVSKNNEILFVSGDENGSNIIKKNLYNGKETIITSRNNTDIAPVWSPDSKEILFYSNREGGFELFIMKSDGSDIRRVLSNEALEKYGIKRGKLLELDEGWNHVLQYRATFSADGNRIAFSADTNKSREIFITSKDGKTVEQLTKNNLHDGMPVFRPVLRN